MRLEYVPARYEAFRTESPDLSLCRVASREKGLYRLLGAAGTRQARVSGKFQHDAKSASDYPAVGDYVLADLNGVDAAMIRRVLPRTSVFLRKAAGVAVSEQVVAANIDTVFLCMSMNGDFNLRRLERYLAVAWDSGATPVVLLTKADLCDNVTGDGERSGGRRYCHDFRRGGRRRTDCALSGQGKDAGLCRLFRRGKVHAD